MASDKFSKRVWARERQENFLDNISNIDDYSRCILILNQKLIIRDLNPGLFNVAYQIKCINVAIKTIVYNFILFITMDFLKEQGYSLRLRTPSKVF